TILNEGVLQMGNNANLGSSATASARKITFDGGDLVYKAPTASAANQVLARDLLLATDGEITLDMAQATGTAKSLMIDGDISGNGDLVLSGVGNARYILRGVSDLQGVIHVTNDGGLQLGDGATAGKGAVAQEIDVATSLIF